MISNRTEKYVEALVRDGPAFDYYKWLHDVRAAEKGSAPVARLSSSQLSAPDESAAARSVEAPACTLGKGAAIKNVSSVSLPERRARDRAKAINVSGKTLRQRLSEVLGAWDEFQETRDRDAVYGYLGAVFDLVTRYNSGDRVDRLVRRAQKFAGLPRDGNADPFTTVIRCTTGGDVDAKTRSKWSRTLRYAAQCKKRGSLKSFIKRKGGINACASRFAAVEEMRSAFIGSFAWHSRFRAQAGTPVLPSALVLTSVAFTPLVPSTCARSLSRLQRS